MKVIIIKTIDVIDSTLTVVMTDKNLISLVLCSLVQMLFL